MKHPVLGLHYERQLQTAREAFVEYAGLEAVAGRQAEIEALPAVQWKGRTLRTVTCAGDYGRGPHQVHLPEQVLWALLSLSHFRCPFHR
jgi:hypothetical protein